MLRFFLACVTICVALLGASGFARAQSVAYPVKPVRVIVPFPPGGSVDLVARMIAPGVGDSIGQPLVLDNRTGASGNIGAELAARSAPDGYTLMVHTIPFIANAFLYKRMPYDPLADFTAVALLSSSPSLLAVHPSVPARTVAELLALARAKPGALNYASAGVATNPHIAGELFNFLGKVNLVAIHFKGGGPGLIATMSGEVGVAFTNFAETSGYVKAGRLRALAVSSRTRSSAMPQIPTIDESGLPGYEFVTWHGMLAPRGTPPAVVAVINAGVRKAMTAPEQARRFSDIGVDVIASTPEAFAAHLKSEYEKWGRVIRERGMRAE